jgi:hypothetical protein
LGRSVIHVTSSGKKIIQAPGHRTPRVNRTRRLPTNRRSRPAAKKGKEAQMSRHTLVVAALALLLSPAAAQHHHPPQDAQLHERFYSTWYMPDNPARSCCNKADCYPTEIKMVGSSIYARRREDGKYILVPAHKIEQNRDNPDGRNHICAPPPSAVSYPPDTVFCFALGGGT